MNIFTSDSAPTDKTIPSTAISRTAHGIKKPANELVKAKVAEGSWLSTTEVYRQVCD